jgi:plasmid stability protein
MAIDLTLRDCELELVEALSRRAARHGHSVEEELRGILMEALERDKWGDLARLLFSMPDVGDDGDFARAR